MANNVSLEVYAAELFDWNYDLGLSKEERKSRRGFDTPTQPKSRSRRFFYCCEVLQVYVAHVEDCDARAGQAARQLALAAATGGLGKKD